MEKMQPIDKRMKFQIDKLLKAAASGKLASKSSSTALAHAPRPDQLMPLEETRPDKSNRSNKNKSDGVYRPPKLAAVHFEEIDAKSKAKKQRQVRHTQICLIA